MYRSEMKGMCFLNTCFEGSIQKVVAILSGRPTRKSCLEKCLEARCYFEGTLSVFYRIETSFQKPNKRRDR